MSVLKPPRGIQLNRSHPLVRGLVGCWLMDELGNGFLFDACNGNHGAIWYGDPVFGDGCFGSAVHFDGVTDTINCGTSDILDLTSAITILVWLKLAANTGRQNIVDRGYYNAPDDQGGYSLQYRGDLTPKRFYFVTRNDGTIVAQYDYDTTNEWVQLVGVYNGSNNILYVNGVEQHSVSSIGIKSTSGRSLQFSNTTFTINGSIDHIMIWGRALSASEVAWLCREPFCMFAVAIEPGLLYPAGQVVLLEATVTASVSVAGLLTREKKLAGTIDTTTALSGRLTLTRRGEIERQWLTEALFNGMTANAFKLGTVLTGGWFWMRRAGCSALYRGPSMERIDFANILTVAEQDAGSISSPNYIPYCSNATYFYVVRRFNNCGYQECTLAAAVKVAIDAEGNLAKPKPNNIFAWRMGQVDGNKIQLIWFYCGLEQKSEPVCFRLYYDSGTGQINYENPIATINYQGRKFHSYQSDVLAAGRYLFAVRAEDADGVENDSLVQLQIQLDTTNPDAIDILSVQNI